MISRHSKQFFAAALGIAVAACGGSGSNQAAGPGPAPAPAPAPAPSPSPSPAPAPGGPPSAGVSFADRCAQSGVIRCIGFDSPSDFNTGTGGTNGAYQQNFGIVPPSGTSDYTRAVRDTTVKASGDSSLRFTIPANSGSDVAGAFFVNFSPDLSVQFGENSEFYVQWRQRFSPELVNTKFAGGGGWKQAIIGTGDKGTALNQIYASCTSLETVVQNTYQRGFPQMYNSCSGSASHGPYAPFEEPFGAYDFKLQNARPSPYCLYSQSSTGYFPPNGNCVGYVANEWFTFQVRIKTGPRVGNEWVNSYVTLWIAREGKASEMVINWGPYNLSAGDPAEDQKYGKVWLLPYHTGKDASVTNPTAYTWYDELVISRNKIADP